MRKKGLSKFYDRLTPEERFKLVVEAQTRGDQGETSQLVQSTPRYTCEEADPAYRALVEASKDLTLTVCLCLLPSVAEIRMARAFAKILPLTCDAFAKHAHTSYLAGRQAGAKRAWRAAGKKGEPPEATEGDALEKEVERASARIGGAAESLVDLPRKRELEDAKETRTSWEAFGNFCRKELELEPKKLVMAWFGAALPEIEELEVLTEDVEPEREEVEKSEADLKEAWLTRVNG